MSLLAGSQVCQSPETLCNGDADVEAISNNCIQDPQTDIQDKSDTAGIVNSKLLIFMLNSYAV